MAIVDRVKNICLTPNTEWPVIAEEATSAGSLITGYVAPLAAIGAVAGFIGGSIVGTSLPFVGTLSIVRRVPFTLARPLGSSFCRSSSTPWRRVSAGRRTARRR